MGDEIKQGQPEGAKADERDGANPEQGSGTPAAGKPDAAQDQQSPAPTPDQIAEWKRRAEQFESMERDYRIKTAERAEYERQLAQYQAAFAELAGRRREEADPLAAAQRDFSEALETFDKARISQAQARLFEVQKERILTEAQQRAAQFALQAIEAREGLKGASRWGKTDPNELARIQPTVEERAMLAAIREKGLGEAARIHAEEMKQREEDAKRASWLGSQMSGRGNGSPSKAPQGDPHPHPVTFELWSDRKKQEHIKKFGVPDYVQRED